LPLRLKKKEKERKTHDGIPHSFSLIIVVISFLCCAGSVTCCYRHHHLINTICVVYVCKNCRRHRPSRDKELATMNEHSSYTSLYSDPRENPFGQGETRKPAIQHYIHEWRSDANPMDTATLTIAVVDQFTDHAVGGICIFVNDGDGNPKLEVLLGLRKYTRNPGSPTSLLFNQVFAYLNDVEEGTGSLIGFDNSMLDMTDEVNVYALDHHKSKLIGDESIELFPTIADGAAQCETVKTRKAMYIPYELVPYVLEKNLSPRQAFMVLHPVMEAAGLLTACKPLVDYLRVAGTLPTVGLAPEVIHDKAGRAIIAERGLLLFMKNQVLLRDLGGLRKRSSTTNPVIAQLTAAVDSMTQNQLRRDEANERRLLAKDKSKSITDIYSSGQLKRLSNICHVDESDLDLLPGVYTSIAESKKENSLAVVQQKMDDLALEYGLMVGPVLPTSALQYFRTLRFHGIDARDLSSGLLPMTFTPPGAMSTGARSIALENNENIVSYELMMGGAHQLTSTDAKELAKSKAYITTDWSEARAQVEYYQPVIGTILGKNHSTTKAYVAAVRYAEGIFLELKEALNAKVGFKQAPSMFTFIFQSHFGGWFREQFISEEPIPPPDLVSMFRRFSMGRNLDWLPVTTGIKILDDLREIVPAFRPSGGGSGGGSGGAAGPPASPRRESSLGKRYNNPDHDQRFKEDNPFCKIIQERKIRKGEEAATEKGVAFPLSLEGKERCHTWHVKGFCYTNCKHKLDHVKLETPKEIEDVYKFARAGFQ
jgi:hypothetical protein